MRKICLAFFSSPVYHILGHFRPCFHINPSYGIKRHFSSCSKANMNPTIGNSLKNYSSKKMVWFAMFRCMVPEILRFENWKNLLTLQFLAFFPISKLEYLGNHASKYSKPLVYDVRIIHLNKTLRDNKLILYN